MHPDELDTPDDWTDLQYEEWRKRQLEAWEKDNPDCV